ncbi:augmin complex subunit dgt5 [Scaptodrosophila lebanonensis]|uniref:Augmin complex subunit dgt5 n=1 Tax=Drosophila lebanonensis TaxID=7225 RepID=A0A6J2UAB4_DROLE|nr:augmin complex subunit dgt5 [Scaptodrosophila lebanonensis]
MAFLEEIEEFRFWATSLGCTPDVLPNEEALRSIFKSRQSQLFVQMQKRVQPRQHVQETRENLLIAKVAQHKDKPIPACGRSFLPRELQTHLMMQDLQRKKENAEVCLAETKKEFDALASCIKTKNMQSISTKHKKDLLESKYNLLKFKLESLGKTYEQELKSKSQIQSTMPVKLNAKNTSEKKAAEAVEQALKELESFYNICDGGNSNGSTSTAFGDTKERLWAQMRTIFSNTPNFLVFNAILKLKEEQLQHIMELNKTYNNADPHSTSNAAYVRPPLDNFEVKLLRTKADLLGLVAKYVGAQNEVVQLEERFAKTYSIFINELQKKVNNCNAITDDETTEDIISDFIVQYNMRNFNRARNEHLTQQIEELRLELESNAKILENHEILLGSIKQVYSDINQSVNRIQYEMLQLSQIKEKIMYSKNMLKNILDDMQAASHNQNAKTQLLSTKLKVNNISMMGMESFNLANDSVFSSTKLDFDANASAMNITLRRSFDNTTLVPGNTTSATAALVAANAGGAPTLPCHLTELNTFTDMPLEKLSCIPRACSFLLSPNPLIVESHELASTIQLAPGLLLTPLGALQEVRKRILWASSIAEHMSDLKFNLDAIIVDPHDFKMKAKCQNEQVVQSLDNLESTGAKTKHLLQRAERIFRFILHNPLHHYVPPKRCYNNATYADYESEFNLYHRIATNGSSIK